MDTHTIYNDDGDASSFTPKCLEDILEWRYNKLLNLIDRYHFIPSTVGQTVERIVIVATITTETENPFMDFFFN